MQGPCSEARMPGLPDLEDATIETTVPPDGTSSLRKAIPIGRIRNTRNN